MRPRRRRDALARLACEPRAKYGDSSDVVDRTEGSRAEATRPPTAYKTGVW
jgi:hypothetical protein